MNPTKYTICIILFFSCHNTSDSNQTKTISLSDTNVLKKIDSINIPKIRLNSDNSIKHFNFSKWYEVSNYYNVFRIAENQIGIAIEIGDGNNYQLIDSMMRMEPESIQLNKLYQNPILKLNFNMNGYRVYPKIKKYFIYEHTNQFNIICQKGIVKSKIIDVYNVYGDCSGFLFLKLENIDIERVGEPLIATKLELDLNYNSANQFDDLLKVQHKREIKNADYYDNYPSKCFASIGDQIFSYSDDFKWRYSGDKSKYNYPGREVYKIKNKKLEKIWGNSIDLFGIACD